MMMKKTVFTLLSFVFIGGVGAQTRTAYLDLYQRGGGLKLRTTLVYDDAPVFLGRKNLGEILNRLAQQGWEIDQTLVGANRTLVFPTRHKFHIILKKSYKEGENPFERLPKRTSSANYSVYDFDPDYTSISKEKTGAE